MAIHKAHNSAHTSIKLSFGLFAFLSATTSLFPQAMKHKCGRVIIDWAGLFNSIAAYPYLEGQWKSFENQWAEASKTKIIDCSQTPAGSRITNQNSSQGHLKLVLQILQPSIQTEKNGNTEIHFKLYSMHEVYLQCVMLTHFPDVQFYANGQCGLPWVKGQQGDWCYLELFEVGGGVANQIRWGGALPRSATSLRVWRSTSNLFAVIAVRVYTLESSNSLFYFSHHEGDHLSCCLHFPPAFGVGSLPVSTHTHRYKPSMAGVLSEAAGLWYITPSPGQHHTTAAEDMRLL